MLRPVEVLLQTVPSSRNNPIVQPFTIFRKATRVGAVMSTALSWLRAVRRLAMSFGKIYGICHRTTLIVIQHSGDGDPLRHRSAVLYPASR